MHLQFKWVQHVNPPLLHELYSKVITALHAGHRTDNCITATITSSDGRELPLKLTWRKTEAEHDAGYTVQLSVAGATPCGVLAEKHGGVVGTVMMRVQYQECALMMEKLCWELVSTPSSVFGEPATAVLLVILYTIASPPQTMLELLHPHKLKGHLQFPEWYEQIQKNIGAFPEPEFSKYQIKTTPRHSSVTHVDEL